MFRKHVTSALPCTLPILAAHATPLSPAAAGVKFLWFIIRASHGKVTGLESRLWGQNVLQPRAN